MKPESDPIDDNEWLLRRVRSERFRTDEVPIISPNAFEPRTKGRDVDLDGISFYRESCISSPADVLAGIDPDKRTQIGIVRIQVRSLVAIGLTVRVVRDSRIAGHVVVPELNSEDYSRDKAKFTHIKLRLAEMASDNVVVWPTWASQ
jgi:hypothetical protein